MCAKKSGTLPFAGSTYHWSLWEPGDDVLKCSAPICGIDTETELIRNNYTTPPLVLFGACSGTEVQLCEWQHFEHYQQEFLEKNPETKFAFFNGPFDQMVMGEDVWIPELNKDNRVLEIQAAYPAYRISTKGWFRPGFTLEMLAQEFLAVKLDKDESVRLAFKRDVPITDKQYQYMAFDAITTYRLGELLQGQPTESIQARAAFVLAKISKNGMLVDKEYVLKQQEHWKQVMDEEGKRLKAFGYPVKTFWADYTGIDFLVRVCTNIGIDEAAVKTSVGDKKNFPQWFWQAMALALYTGIKSKSPISEIRAYVRDLLVMSVSKIKPSTLTEYKKVIYDALHQIMERLECLDCLEGIGENPKRPSGSAAWRVLSVLTSETLASGDPQHNYLKDDVLEEVDKEFQSLHEQNRGWLSDFKPLSQSKFLQQHVKRLKKQYPELSLPLTDAAKDAVNQRLREESLLAEKEHRAPRHIDVTDLETYQVTGKEEWRFEDVGIDDPFLKSYWAFKHAEKMLSTYITLKYVDSDGRVHPRFQNYVRTGRTACSRPNLQNLPSKAEKGLREMYIPRPGRVLMSIDYNQEELCALGQHCKLFLGHSRMYDLINHGLDLHGMFSAYRDGKLAGYDLNNLSESDIGELKKMLKFYKEDASGCKSRALSKICNFGLGGGMAADTFYKNVRSAGFKVTLEEVRQMIEAWYTFYPEIEEFHNLQIDGYVPASTFDKNKSTEEDSEDDVEEDIEYVDGPRRILRDADGNPLEDKDRMVKLFRTTNALGMVKAKGTKCAVANFNFQSYAAAANKIAMWWVYYTEWKRAHDEKTSQVFDIVNFIHDELIFEVDADKVDEVSKRNADLMVRAVKTVMPGILIKAEPAAMTRWSKAAEPTFDEKGHLIPVEVTV